MLQAVGSTVNTAGRTVLFSGLTFAIATAGLLVFEPAIIRAIAIGAVCVVLIAILTALVLVPALLGYLGERLLKPGLLTRIPGVGALAHPVRRHRAEEGVFSKLARRVQRAPVLVALGRHRRAAAARQPGAVDDRVQQRRRRHPRARPASTASSPR